MKWLGAAGNFNCMVSYITPIWVDKTMSVFFWVMYFVSCLPLHCVFLRALVWKVEIVFVFPCGEYPISLYAIVLVYFSPYCISMIIINACQYFLVQLHGLELLLLVTALILLVYIAQFFLNYKIYLNYEDCISTF